jgi:tRNA pseudouridine55 synthase
VPPPPASVKLATPAHPSHVPTATTLRILRTALNLHGPSITAALKPGIELVHKPVGVTSFSLVQTRLEQLARTPGKRLPLCHAGALDPFASGLILMLYGGATKLMELHHAIPKRYVATIRWGTETDNGDPLGKVVRTGDPSSLTAERIDAALKPMLGWTEQIPPSTSNKRVDGERAYQKAHRGEQFELPPSRVYLHEARFLSHDLPRQSVLQLTCRGGYYVRSLARDLGRNLGCFAHLSALHRTAIGPWSDSAQSVHLSGRALLPWCRSRALTDHEVGALRKDGRVVAGAIEPPDWELPSGWPDPDAPIRAFHLGKLIALLKLDGDQLIAGQAFRGGL